VLYILFGVLFIVFSHLQERLQRNPEGRCPLRYSWDHVSLSANDKDIEVQIPDSPYTMNLNIHVDATGCRGFQRLERAIAR